MRTFDFLIFGNNSGAMVAAIELSRKYSVALVNPGNNWGGHFSGIRELGQNFDIGMNYLEFTTFHSPSDDIFSYDPKMRNDSARFFHFVEDRVRKSTSVLEVTGIKCLTDGVMGSDIMMANQGDILRKLPRETRHQIRREVEAILSTAPSPLHASRKKMDEALFLGTPFSEVSLANHGPTFHTVFIEPICQKILNLSCAEIPALFHRIAWAPLFYPETLRDFLDGTEELPQTLFHFPESGSFSEIIRQWEQRIRSEKAITLVHAPEFRVRKEKDFILSVGEETLRAPELVWCHDLLPLARQIGFENPNVSLSKASVSLAFSWIPAASIAAEFSTLYVCRDNSPVFRITNQEFSAGRQEEMVRMVFEMSFGWLESRNLVAGEDVMATLNRFAMENGILHSPLTFADTTLRHFRSAVTQPTSENLKIFNAVSSFVGDRLSGMRRIGPAAGFVSTSFNDQLVQAMNISKKFDA